MAVAFGSSIRPCHLLSPFKEGDSDSIVRIMTMPMEVMIRGMQAGDDGELLIQLCKAAEIEEAIDVAMIDEGMHSDILGENMHLRDLLMLAVSDGKKLVKGWAVGVTKYGEGNEQTA